MFELLGFLIVQFILNLIVFKFLNKVHLKSYKRFSYFIFAILIIVYPIAISQFYNQLYFDSDDVEIIKKCGMPLVGIVFFNWIFGFPSVLFVQFLLNKFILRIPLTIQK